MVQINDISVDVANNIPIREDEINKIDQTSKYKILNNGSYYVQHNWDNKYNVSEKMAVPLPRCGH